MSHAQDVNVELTAELVAMLTAAVDAGEYASMSEAVRDALQVWSVQRTIMRDGTGNLRLLWEEGLLSGTLIEAEPVFTRLRDKYARQAATE